MQLDLKLQAINNNGLCSTQMTRVIGARFNGYTELLTSTCIHSTKHKSNSKEVIKIFLV